MLTVVPITLGEAQRWIDEHHSHLDPPMRCILAVSIADDGRRCCVAVAEWPKAHHREGYVTAIADVLAVARDALLERGSIAEVLDLARTMALERVAGGLSVAWVGPVESSATVLHTWWVQRRQRDEGPELWWVWRDGLIHSTGGHYGGVGTHVLWTPRVVRARVEKAVAVLDADVMRPSSLGRPPGPPHPTIGPEPTGRL